MLFKRPQTPLCAALLCAVLLLPVSVLADDPITFEEIDAIRQASYDKMGTGGAMRNYGDPPGDDDLPYAQALAVAQQAIGVKYGVPAEVLDAIGLYPRFHYGSWEFYWSSVRDESIPSNPRWEHADGEGVAYLVEIDSLSGTAYHCQWNLEDFWPLAQEFWDAGMHDVVYKQAQTADFYRQTARDQERWRALLEEDGYDMSVIRPDGSLLEDRALRRELDWADLSLAVEPEDDARVAAAWQAIEDAYGLNTQVMREYAYIALYSPLNTGTQDIMIWYSNALRARRLRRLTKSGDKPEPLALWEDQLSFYLNRLGMFMVQLDPQTGDVVSVTRRAPDTDEDDLGDPSLLLGRPDWDAGDLNEWVETVQDYAGLMSSVAACGEIPDELLTMISDALMRSYGGNRFVYSSRLERWDDIGTEAALAIAVGEAALCFDMSVSDVLAYYEHDEPWYSWEDAVYYCSFDVLPNAPEDARLGVVIEIDAATGEVLYSEISCM